MTSTRMFLAFMVLFVLCMFWARIGLPQEAVIEVPPGQAFELSWEAGGSPDGYEVYKCLAGRPWELLGQPTTNSISDSLMPNKASVYRVRGYANVTYETCNNYPCSPDEIILNQQRFVSDFSDISDTVVAVGKPQKPGKIKITISITTE